MIYTSYFAKLKSLPKNIIPISICGKSPNWYTGLQYKKLASKYNFFMKWKQSHDNDYYIKCFNEQVLNKLNPLYVLTELYKLAGINKTLGDEREICLICYKKPSDFCHRHLVADWFNKVYLECEEYTF